MKKRIVVTTSLLLLAFATAFTPIGSFAIGELKAGNLEFSIWGCDWRIVRAEKSIEHPYKAERIISEFQRYLGREDLVVDRSLYSIRLYEGPPGSRCRSLNKRMIVKGGDFLDGSVVINLRDMESKETFERFLKIHEARYEIWDNFPHLYIVYAFNEQDFIN